MNIVRLHMDVLNIKQSMRVLVFQINSSFRFQQVHKCVNNLTSGNNL